MPLSYFESLQVNIISSDQTRIVFQVGILDCTAEINVMGTDYSLQLKPVPREGVLIIEL